MKKISYRLDLQIIAFTICILLFSTLCVFFVNYMITHDSMIDSLKERSDKIHTYVETNIDPAAFTLINTPEDRAQPMYSATKQTLEKVRDASGVLYLYTAKKRSDGTMIYLVDGLNEANTDFRNPGNSIEIEIIPDLTKALAGETVFPQQIKETSWGHIFISYYPMHDEHGNVIGAVGIEFDATRYYAVQTRLRNTTLISITLLSLFCAFLAFTFFKGKTAIIEQQAFAMDELTKLPNRKAFIHTIKIFPTSNTSIISIDLNHLKEINRRFGNQIGDECIRKTCRILQSQLKKNHVLYRMGNDEFLMLLPNTNQLKASESIEKMNNEIESTYINETQPLSLSYGCAAFDPEKDHDLFDTYIRADEQRYKYKDLSRKSFLQ